MVVLIVFIYIVAHNGDGIIGGAAGNRCQGNVDYIISEPASIGSAAGFTVSQIAADKPQTVKGTLAGQGNRTDGGIHAQHVWNVNRSQIDAPGIRQTQIKAKIEQRG